MSLGIAARELGRRLFGSPARDRLASFVADAWADLDRELQTIDSADFTEPWARSAYALLLRAEADLAKWEIESGWTAALSAQRAILSNPHNPERIHRAAIMLRREADKITGWRAKAIQDLICGPKGELLAIPTEERMRVIDAAGLRDDFSQNTWFKIMLRRRHLFSLFSLLWLTLSLCLFASWLHVLPEFFGEPRLVGTVILFGVLGAAVSVAQGLVAEDVSARIPAQQIGSFLVWMRPGIGAAAALFVLAILRANQQFHVLGDYTTDTSVTVIFSFIAGYSERFIVGTIESISKSAVK